MMFNITYRAARKAPLSTDLYFLYEMTLGETNCFCKPAPILIRKCADSMDYTGIQIKFSSSREMTRSMM